MKEVLDALGFKWYTKVETETHLFYYVSEGLDQASEIYTRRKDDKPSEGYGGAHLEFPLEDGSVDIVQGPWHTNAEHLKAETGIDLTNRYIRRIEVGLTRNVMDVSDLVYSEHSVGPYPDEDAKTISQRYANMLNCRVYVYTQTRNGASSFAVEPE